MGRWFQRPRRAALPPSPTNGYNHTRQTTSYFIFHPADDDGPVAPLSQPTASNQRPATKTASASSSGASPKSPPRHQNHAQATVVWYQQANLSAGSSPGNRTNRANRRRAVDSAISKGGDCGQGRVRGTEPYFQPVGGNTISKGVYGNNPGDASSTS